MSAPMDVPKVDPTPPVPAPPPAPPASNPAPTPAAPEASSWRDALDADLREAPSIAKFSKVGDLAKSYVELQGKMGQKGLLLPKPDAPPEAWNEVYTALGRPEKADQYDLGEFAPPEGLNWDPGFQQESLGWMHEAGLSSRQAQAILGKYAGKLASETQAAAEREAEVVGRWTVELQRNWGSALEQKLDLAERAFLSLVPEAHRDMISSARLPDGGTLGDHPAFLEMMATVGQRWAEAQLLGDKEPTRFAKTPEEAGREIKKRINDPVFRAKLTDARHPEHEEAKAEWQRLHEQAEPGAKPASEAILVG